MRVVLVEPPGQQGYVPIAAAYLAATARADRLVGPELSVHLQLGHSSEPVDATVEEILADGPLDVLGVSCQGWGMARADAIASRIADKCPHALVIYGGNHVSNGGGMLMKERPYLDVVANGEGEFVFRDILQTWQQTQERDTLQALPGTTVRRTDGEIVTGPERPRITDLSRVTSPYLSGELDSFLHENCTALLETNRGCPYSCSFCYWGEAIGARVQQFPLERVKAEMRYLAELQVDAWFICDANFGMFQRDSEIVDYIVELRAEYGYPRTVHTNWAKGSNERVVSLCAKLNNAGVHSTYTLALQSATPEALRLAHRKNMKINRVEELSRLCRQYEVVPRGELIWGLPGESYDEFRESFDVLAPHTDALSVYPHYLLPNTEFSAHGNDLGLRAEKAEMDTDYAYCVEHPAMSRDSFLTGMRFIISNNILRVGSGFYRLYPRVAMAAAGLSYATTTESLGEWITRSRHPIARRLARLYRIPMATHRLSLGEVWTAIFQDRDGFVDMLRRYADETFHAGLPEQTRDILQAAFEFDALTFPIVESGTGYRTRVISSEYDMLAVRRGGPSLPERAPKQYSIRWPLGLRDYPINKWYFGIISFAAEISDVTEDDA